MSKVRFQHLINSIIGLILLTFGVYQIHNAVRFCILAFAMEEFADMVTSFARLAESSPVGVFAVVSNIAPILEGMIVGIMCFAAFAEWKSGGFICLAGFITLLVTVYRIVIGYLHGRYFGFSTLSISLFLYSIITICSGILWKHYWAKENVPSTEYKSLKLPFVHEFKLFLAAKDE